MALDAIEQLLVANHGFTVTPEGAVVSPNGKIRNVVNGKTTFTPYTPPTTEPTFAEQFAAQQAQAIADTNQVRQDEAIASGSDTYQSVATDGSGAVTDVSVGTPVNLQEQILSVGQPTFSSGSPTQALPAAPVSTLTPIQQAADELKDLVDTVGLSSKSKQRNDDRIVFFNDGTKTSDILEKYGVTMDEWRDATKVPGGITGGISNREQAVDRVVSGIDYALMSDEERQVLKDENSAAQKLADNDKDAFYGKDADSTGRITSGANKGEYSQAFYDQQKRLSDPTRTGNFLTDVQTGLSDLGDRASNLFGFGEEKYNDADAFNEGQGSVVNYADIVGDTPYSYKNTDLGKNYDNSYTGEIPLSELGAYTGDVATYGGDMGVGQSQMYDGMSGTYDLYDEPLEGGLNIPGTNLTITAGGPSGPGAGSNTGSGGSNVGGGGDGNGGGAGAGGGDTGGGGIGVGVPVIGPGDIGGGTGGTGGGIGGGIGTGGIGGSQPDPNTFIVPSTVNYGEDPRFANLAPKFNVSNAPMPIFNRFDPAPSIPPVSAGQTLPEGYKIINGQVYQDPNVYAETDAGVVGTQLALNPVGSPPTSLLAQGGIVGLAGGGDPMDQVSKDFFIRQIPRALTEKDGGGMARKLANIHDIHDLGIDEDTFLALKYYRGPGGMKHGGVAERGYSHEGIGTLNATARNMFRPMVS